MRAGRTIADMFDVFVAYHSSDRKTILDVCRILRSQGVLPWVDIEQLRPGAWVQHEIRSAIYTTRSAIVCVGMHGLGPWQTLEVQAMIERCVAGEVRLIPVLLPGLDALPDELLFLRPLNFVRFERSVFEAEPVRLLIWGITGERSSLPCAAGVLDVSQPAHALLSVQGLPSG